MSAPPGGDDISPTVGGIDPTWMDVKAIETNVATLFGGFGVPVPAITANARVALMQPESLTGLRPFAAADARLHRDARGRSSTAPTLTLSTLQLSGAARLTRVLGRRAERSRCRATTSTVDVSSATATNRPTDRPIRKVGYILKNYGRPASEGIFHDPPARLLRATSAPPETSCEFGIRASSEPPSTDCETSSLHVSAQRVSPSTPADPPCWALDLRGRQAGRRPSPGDRTFGDHIVRTITATRPAPLLRRPSPTGRSTMQSDHGRATIQVGPQSRRPPSPVPSPITAPNETVAPESRSTSHRSSPPSNAGAGDPCRPRARRQQAHTERDGRLRRRPDVRRADHERLHSRRPHAY